ncbi:MAG: hypothetical protein JJT77_08455 [Crocinitomicaceae bacterium]|nr:hypothetical protein [Crocinitomicaceae bacterium]
MKKMIYGGLFLALVGIGFVGCEKENNHNRIQNTQYDGVTTDGELLIFESSEVFEKLSSTNDEESNLDELEKFDAYAKNIPFPHIKNNGKAEASFLAKIDDQFDEDDELPDFIQAILNENRAVQIGEYIYCLDFENALVYVLPSKLRDDYYQDLIKGNIQNNNILVYRFDENVVEMIEAGESSELKGKSEPNQSNNHPQKLSHGGINLIANWEEQFPDFDVDEPTLVQGALTLALTTNVHRTVLRARYQRFGVHNTLKIKARNGITEYDLNGAVDPNQVSAGFGWSWTESSLNYRIIWDRRWKRRGRRYRNDPGTWWCNRVTVGSGSFKAQSYRGMRGLSHYTITGKEQVRQGNQWFDMNFAFGISGCGNGNHQVGVSSRNW